ncbi:hypothetical protein SAMN05216196_105191 [Lutimaribacter pacificus]|uniref:Acetolactate synthase n=1 Tax=Lutimaribacter pacificus TaxID=391948 RepID=A0A1H0J9Q7_9RHOB|nr:DUF6497 family protein [Lutimaribacter pacificus]SDO40243.1 hypothetical protein SAMN05216196_105191 [Lutimaribacter pacificus]SHK12548.1 hypothetical protein SAMN05444142_103349 [Lutimaribacter pacificus]
MVKWIRVFVALGGTFACATTAAGQEEAPAVPSGIALHLQEIRLEDGLFDQPRVARFRFVAPAIGGAAGFAEVEGDFAHLCETVALPWLTERGDAAPRVVISYASREIEFGSSDPDTVQFFEAFRVENGTCIWEGF